MSDLRPLLSPRSIAVIGASDREGNVGGRAVQLFQKFGYPGKVWPVNPGRDSVAGIKCYRSLDELPEPADLAILALPAEGIAAQVEACAAAGILHGIAWAGGFAEVGPEGAELQRVLVETCRRTGFKLLGPNSIGLVNSWQPMTASFGSSLFATDKLLTGPVSIVSQSGGTAASAQALANQAGFGFRYLISSGNEAVLDMADFIDGFVDEPGTRIITAYVEGVRDRGRFLAALDRARVAGKPVVMLKGGVTAAGASAALAHTGALAGAERVWLAVAAEQAVIPVNSQQEMLDVALFLSTVELDTLPKGPGVAVVVTGGGAGILATDLCGRAGLSVPPLSEDTYAKLRPLMPPIASVANPFDFTPDMLQPKWMALLPQALDVIAADPAVHTILFHFGTLPRAAGEVAQAVLDLRKRTKKNVCMAWMLTPPDARAVLQQAGAYAVPEIGRAAGVIARLVKYQADLAQPPRRPVAARIGFDWSRHVPNPTVGQVVSEHDCHRLLADAGFAVAAGRLVRDGADLAAATAAVAYPLAMKGISPQVTHRAAAGLLALDIRSDAEAGEAYRRLTARAAEIGVVLDGIYLQHMLRPAHELLLSGFVDPVFGPMVSVGAGGVLTEILDDVVLERAPFDAAVAARMQARLRLMRRVRAAEHDLGALADYVARFSQLIAAAPWRRFTFEINPLSLERDAVTALDGLLVIDEP